MKKILTIISLVLVSIVFIVGCSDLKKTDKLYIGDCPDNMIGMGKKYNINNLEDGTYEIEFTAKEYENGSLKEELMLQKSTIKQNGINNPLTVGIIDGNAPDYNLNLAVNDSEYECDTLDFLKDNYNTGIAISILEKDKYIELDNKVAIAIYSIGKENSTTETLNIDKEFKIGKSNLKDLVIYVKIHKVK